jgi:hypothetical protein
MQPLPQDRREFLKLAGTATAAALLPRRLRAADAPPPAAAPTAAKSPAAIRPFENDGSVFAWDLHDEGVEKILDNLQQMSAINSIYIVGLMHPEKRPLTAGVYPHNPVRQTWTAEDARIYWHPDLKRYGRIKPRLSDNDWLNQTDWVRVLVDAARKRGLKVGVEISHTLVDKERAEGELADVVERNIHGEITHVRPWLRPICPNHPDTRAYAIALFSDLVANYDPDFVMSCIVSMDEGGPDKGACFCPACKKAATEHGFDLAKAQTALLANPRDQPAATDWQNFRCDSVARFYAGIHDAVHALKPVIDLRYNMHQNGRNPLDWGIDVVKMKPHLGSIRIMDYAEQDGNAAALGAKRQWLTENRQKLGPDFWLLSAVAVRPKATPDLIKQGIQLCVDCGMNGITIAQYDGGDFPNLRAVRDGLVAAKIPVPPASSVSPTPSVPSTSSG